MFHGTGSSLILLTTEKESISHIQHGRHFKLPVSKLCKLCNCTAVNHLPCQEGQNQNDNSSP